MFEMNEFDKKCSMSLHIIRIILKLAKFIDYVVLPLEKKFVVIVIISGFAAALNDKKSIQKFSIAKSIKCIVYFYYVVH